MANFLRRPLNSVPQAERPDETISNDMEPPRYSSLEDAENKSHRPANKTGRTQAQAGDSRHAAIPSAPTSHGAVENDQGEDTDDYIPPPPSYEDVITYEDMYSVSDTKPNRV